MQAKIRVRLSIRKLETEVGRMLALLIQFEDKFKQQEENWSSDIFPFAKVSSVINFPSYVLRLF